jgi:hypothetical protein
MYAVESTSSFAAGILHACKAAKKWLHAVSSPPLRGRETAANAVG